MKQLTAVCLTLLLPTGALAQSGLVSDDFNTPDLGSIWSIVDPQDDVTIGLQGLGTDDAQVRIDVPAGVSHDLWRSRNFAPRILQSASNTDFSIDVKFDSLVQERFQLQGLVVQETFDHLLRFEVYHDGTRPRLFAARIFTSDDALVFLNSRIDDQPTWLRVERVGDTWSFLTSLDGLSFTPAVTFDYELTATEVGVHAGNHGFPAEDSPAFVALVDYFQNNESPIVEEDGVFDTEPPIADAGPEIEASVGSTVELNGTGSSDDQTTPENLAFLWTIVSKPDGSTSELDDDQLRTPSLVVDVPGEYVVELIVTDEAGLMSAPSTVTISTLNQAPVADAGQDLVVEVDEAILLDGLGSYDPDDDALTYAWSILSSPAGSASTLVGATSATPSFTPDAAGEFVFELVVNDGMIDSVPTTVSLSAIDSAALARRELRRAARDLRHSGWCDYRRWYFRLIMHRQVRLAARDVRCGNIQYARCRIEFLLSVTDGCVERGAPDGWSYANTNRVDWVVDCTLQQELHGHLSTTLAYLQ